VKPDPGRRALLRGRPSFNSSEAIRPPWAVDADRFIDICERCHDCIDVCPESIIKRGDGGFPEVDFQRGECTFCEKCAQVCSVAAFEPAPRDIEGAWHLVPSVRSSVCLSLNAVTCRVCGDRCEADAIRFRLHTGAMAEPLVDVDRCSGCGACVFSCPVGAISICAGNCSTDSTSM